MSKEKEFEELALEVYNKNKNSENPPEYFEFLKKYLYLEGIET